MVLSAGSIIEIVRTLKMIEPDAAEEFVGQYLGNELSEQGSAHPKK